MQLSRPKRVSSFTRAVSVASNVSFPQWESVGEVATQHSFRRCLVILLRVTHGWKLIRQAPLNPTKTITSWTLHKQVDGPTPSFLFLPEAGKFSLALASRNNPKSLSNHVESSQVSHDCTSCIHISHSVRLSFPSTSARNLIQLAAVH